jgi:hypothetical protein
LSNAGVVLEVGSELSMNPIGSKNELFAVTVDIVSGEKGDK